MTDKPGTQSSSEVEAMLVGAVEAPVVEPVVVKHKSRRWVVFLVIAVLVAVVGGGGVVACSTLATRLEAEASLEDAREMLAQADVVVTLVDEIVRAEVEPALAARADDALGRLDEAAGLIEEAIALLEEVRDDLSEEDQMLAAALLDSARPRLEMFEHAGPILEANTKAANAVGPAGEGVAAILDAEELSVQAVEKFNLHTEEGVTASTELSNQAIDKLQDAKVDLSEAATAFPEADFSAFIEYVDAKVALLEESKEMDALWLSGKVEEANDMLSAYSEHEQEVQESADALPESETAPIAVAYDELATEATVLYFEARSEAAQADSLLQGLLDETASEES